MTIDGETVEQIREYWFGGSFRQHTQLSERLQCATDDINFLLGMVNTLEEENEKLQKRNDWLTCLEQAGVDNWTGIDYAYELQEKENV